MMELRRLRPADGPAIESLARDAFRRERFYRVAFGFSPGECASYWRAFLRMLHSDPAGRGYVLERGGRVVAAILLGFPGFPAPWRGARFLLEMARAMGLARWFPYLRFVVGYERFFADAAPSVQALWTIAHPRDAGAGYRLIRLVRDVLRAEGWSRFSWFADVRNRGLRAIYRKLGAVCTRTQNFCGGTGGRFELVL